ncbi:MAG: type II toxin-antitoxin system HicB family antitoxin [Flavobacteriales bacterium]|nr:type II toxin-antitoxin system HicB family antitoxin [Flavobacteriales bacterium]
MKANTTYTAIIIEAEDGTFSGYVEEVPGVISQGNTEKELRTNLLDALQMMLGYYKEETFKLLLKTPARSFKKEILVLT